MDFEIMNEYVEMYEEAYEDSLDSLADYWDEIPDMTWENV